MYIYSPTMYPLSNLKLFIEQKNIQLKVIT